MKSSCSNGYICLMATGHGNIFSSSELEVLLGKSVRKGLDGAKGRGVPANSHETGTFLRSFPRLECLLLIAGSDLGQDKSIVSVIRGNTEQRIWVPLSDVLQDKEDFLFP